MTVDELRQAVLALPPLENPDAPRFTWDFRRRDLRRKMLIDDPHQFMDWPVSCECLWSAETKDAMDELGELRASADWPRWQPVVDYPFFNGTLVHQAYSLYHWERLSGKQIGDLELIAEFGGGYGQMAEACHRLGFRGRFVIYDFPELGILQRFYAEKQGFPLETTSDLLYWQAQTGGGDLMIALCSLSETEQHDRDRYMALSPCRSYLFRFQDYYLGDNIGWFTGFAMNYSNLTWHLWQVPYYPSHYYLIGF